MSKKPPKCIKTAMSQIAFFLDSLCSCHNSFVAVGGFFGLFRGIIKLKIADFHKFQKYYSWSEFWPVKVRLVPVSKH